MEVRPNNKPLFLRLVGVYIVVSVMHGKTTINFVFNNFSRTKPSSVTGMSYAHWSRFVNLPLNGILLYNLSSNLILILIYPLQYSPYAKFKLKFV